MHYESTSSFEHKAKLTIFALEHLVRQVGNAVTNVSLQYDSIMQVITE